MIDEQEAETGRRPRRFRTVSEKRRIAELTFEPGGSVALLARAHGVNANQVFKWRRALKRGELNEPASGPTGLLPVMFSAPCVAADVTGQVDAKEPRVRFDKRSRDGVHLCDTPRTPCWRSTTARPKGRCAL